MSEDEKDQKIKALENKAAKKYIETWEFDNKAAKEYIKVLSQGGLRAMEKDLGFLYNIFFHFHPSLQEFNEKASLEQIDELVEKIEGAIDAFLKNWITKQQDRERRRERRGYLPSRLK